MTQADWLKLGFLASIAGNTSPYPVAQGICYVAAVVLFFNGLFRDP